MPDKDERVADVPEALVTNPSTLPPEAPISDIVRLLRARPESRMVYVVDGDGRLVGTVSWRCVLRVTKARVGARMPGVWSLVNLLRNLKPETARDLMRESTPVRPDTPVRDALLLMGETQQNDLPVVDEAGRLVGELNGMHIMEMALRVFEKTEAELARSRDPPS